MSGDYNQEWRDEQEIERLQASLQTMIEHSEKQKQKIKQLEAEVARLKAFWYADSDPEATDYAEDFHNSDYNIGC